MISWRNIRYDPIHKKWNIRHKLLKDNIMADAFFRVFDEDKSGSLSFYEYMLVKTAPKLESQEDRLGWIFHAFDSDGGGSIDNTEVVHF